MYRMPKRGEKYKYNWYNPQLKKHSEHDVRVAENTPRVTVKHGQFSKKGPHLEEEAIDVGGGSFSKKCPHLEEEAIDVGGGSGFNNGPKEKGNKEGSQSGSPAPHKGSKQQKLLKNSSNWFRVTLLYGNRCKKKFVLRTLSERVAPLPFRAFCWSPRGASVIFYVDEYELADKILSLDRQIQCPNGFNMVIRVIGCIPNISINANMKEKLKLTIAKRYNVAKKALDLTKFYADPDLEGLFCALFKSIILLPVLQIISETIPEIEALNLHDNRIQTLSSLGTFDKKLPHLKILHLGNNKIRDITALDALMGFPIVDLILEGNPLCDKVKEQSAYISKVRKKFPKVIKLDGIDLPPPIIFDIGKEVTLPPTQQIFLCNDEAHGIVCQVLEQYFEIFDSESRQPLLQIYHENVMFSMTSTYPYRQNSKNANQLDWYNTDSRNLLRVQDGDQRMKLLRQGQFSVVSFLSKMPATKHDIRSFTVDLSLFMPQMLLLTVTGIFKELQSGHESEPLRFFCRTLVVVPVGSGFCIANEQLHVTNATEEQAKHAFKMPDFKPEAAPAVAALSPVAVSSAPVPVAIPTMPDENTKQQMIQAMSQESGMNLEWSHKCLESTNWDFDRAEFVFMELQKQGTIPAVAFV